LSLFEEIQIIICEQLVLIPGEVKPDTSFIEDLGTDSLDTIELVMALEEKFNIEIPDEDTKEMNTVADVVKYIRSKINREQNSIGEI